MENTQAFKELVDHLDALRLILAQRGFSVEERAAVLGAEARNFYLSLDVVPVLDGMLQTLREQG